MWQESEYLLLWMEGGVQDGRVLTMEEQGNSEIPAVFYTLSRETATGVHVSLNFYHMSHLRFDHFIIYKLPALLKQTEATTRIEMKSLKKQEQSYKHSDIYKRRNV